MLGTEPNSTPNVREAWAAFLNPDVVRTKLVSAGLYLVAHEMLIDTIKGHPLSFFAERWTRDGPEQSAKYKSVILDGDPKGKGDALRGSIAWLRSMDVISEGDENALRVITDARNRLAHEMSSLVGGQSDPDFVTHFGTLVALTAKIEKWWIINVEMGTDPEVDWDLVDEDGILPGPTWTMQILAKVALGDGDDAWSLHRQFSELWPQKPGDG